MKWTLIIIIGVFTSYSGIHDYGENRNDKFPPIKGYELVEEYPVYLPESLWDYINGAADTYLSYHFQDLHIAEYVDKTGESIKVEVYKHKSPEYAYGIYCSERFPDYNFIDIGVQGYAEEGLVHFLSGPNYVKVISNSETPRASVLLQVATEISHWLNTDSTLPKLLSIFPPDKKADKSECFIAKNFLGHEFLNDAFVANYQLDDQEFSIFIIEREGRVEARKIVEDYLKFSKIEVTEITDGQYDIEDRYNGNITLILEGNMVFGFLNCDSPSILKNYSGLIKEGLRKIE